MPDRTIVQFLRGPQGPRGDIGPQGPTGAAGAAGAAGLSGGDWAIAVDTDFTALATSGSAVLSGAQTIGGKAWTSNLSTHASEMRVVNGEGLVIGHNADNTDIFNATQTGPYWQTKLADLGIDPSKDVRIWAYFAHNADANYEACEIGIGDSAKQHFHSAVRLYDGTSYAGPIWSNRQYQSSLTTQLVQSTDTAHNVVMLKSNQGNLTKIFTGTYSAGFPATTALRHRASMIYQPTVIADPANMDMAFRFGCATVNTSGNLRVSLKRLLVEYR